MTLALAGCYEEDELTATKAPENVYGEWALPQGNHDYDLRIVEKLKKYATFFLYKYEDKDYWWGVKEDIRWKWDTVKKIAKSGYAISEADEDYVGNQLTLLEETWLNYFPDTLLRRTLPYKVLLADTLMYVDGVKLEVDPERFTWKAYNIYSGYDYICVGWGNKNILTMTAEEKNTFKVDLCCGFLKRLLASLLIQRSIEFTSVSTYGSSIGQNQLYENGLLDINARSIESDWEAYIKMIVSTPLVKLEAEGGFLHESIDVKGMIRKKYDIMVKYFMDEYSIDLQAIGNDVKE